MKFIASLFAGIGGSASMWIVTALLAIAIFGAGYIKGAASEQIDQAKVQLDAALAYAGEIVASQDKADRLTAENTALRAAQTPMDRIITKEVIRYVQITPPALRVVLPGTWRLRHDAAATGDPALAEAGPVAAGTADPVEDAAALGTVADNYIACRDAIAKVEGWQRRYFSLESSQ